MSRKRTRSSLAADDNFGPDSSDMTRERCHHYEAEYRSGPSSGTRRRRRHDDRSALLPFNFKPGGALVHQNSQDSSQVAFGALPRGQIGNLAAAASQSDNSHIHQQFQENAILSGELFSLSAGISCDEPEAQDPFVAVRSHPIMSTGFQTLQNQPLSSQVLCDSQSASNTLYEPVIIPDLIGFTSDDFALYPPDDIVAGQLPTLELGSSGFLSQDGLLDPTQQEQLLQEMLLQPLAGWHDRGFQEALSLLELTNFSSDNSFSAPEMPLWQANGFFSGTTSPMTLPNSLPKPNMSQVSMNSSFNDFLLMNDTIPEWQLGPQSYSEGMMEVQNSTFLRGIALPDIQNVEIQGRDNFTPLLLVDQNPSLEQNWLDMTKSISGDPELVPGLGENLSASTTMKTSNQMEACHVDDSFWRLQFPPAESVPESPKRRALCVPIYQKILPAGSIDGPWDIIQLKKPSKTTRGGRKRPLDAETRANAGQMRKVGNCFRCWLTKVSCSGSAGSACARCHDQPPSLGLRMCNRNHLYDYDKLFFPDVLVARYQKSTLDEMMNHNIRDFSDNQIELELSSGPLYPPIVVTACEFLPKPKQTALLVIYRLSSAVNAPTPAFKRVYAPPYGLTNVDHRDQLKGKCLQHINETISLGRDPEEEKSEDMAAISARVYEAVNQYCRTEKAPTKNTIVRKALMLQAMHFFMSRMITFTESSAQKAFCSIRNPHELPYTYNGSSTLLNLQVKQVMYEVLREKTLEVLQQLDKNMRTRSRALWASSLCVILILSMCMEAVQVATDMLMVHKIMNGEAQGSPVPTRDKGIEICRSLDDLPFRECTENFHDIYGSRKTGTGSGQGFNPIRDGIVISADKVFSPEAVKLVDALRQIMDQYDLDDIAKNPEFGQPDDLLADHMRFRRMNSGRLVSTFLKSFR